MSHPTCPTFPISHICNLVLYQAIPESHLCESLNVKVAELGEYLSKRSWALEGGVVKVNLNDDNTAKPRKPDEGSMLRYDQMTKILSSTWSTLG